MDDSLLKKIHNLEANICIVGLGRVGLPLACVFASKGLKVIGLDVDRNRLKSISNQKSPFHDPALQEILEKVVKSGNLLVSDSSEAIKDNVDVIIITVGTPNTLESSIDYSQLYSALDEISALDLHDKFIILRSTMPPNTTKEIVIPYLENKTQLKCGNDFLIAVCPERILEGHALKEIHELPEVIGGFNESSNKLAAELFLLINPDKDILYTSMLGAEFVKLFTNIYRYISFALSNEFAVWAEKFGLDAKELIKIANYKYPRANIPIPGFVGGPCLSKDGTFLDNNTTFSSIISAAWKLNEAIPQHITNNIRKISGNLFNKKIAILGLSFKANSDDLRNSPSVKLVKILESIGAVVKVHDPFVKGTYSLSDALQSSEIVVIATNHSKFKEISQELNNCGCKIIYDVWGIYNENEFDRPKYYRFGKALE